MVTSYVITFSVHLEPLIRIENLQIKIKHSVVLLKYADFLPFTLYANLKLFKFSGK